MLMKDILALEHPLSMKADDEIEVSLALLDGSLHLVSIHLRVIHGVVAV